LSIKKKIAILLINVPKKKMIFQDDDAIFLSLNVRGYSWANRRFQIKPVFLLPETRHNPMRPVNSIKRIELINTKRSILVFIAVSFQIDEWINPSEFQTFAIKRAHRIDNLTRDTNFLVGEFGIGRRVQDGHNHQHIRRRA
jgi:hypothetical protein